MNDHPNKNEIIKVFVACSPDEFLPMKVLEYSIMLSSSQPVQVVPLYSINRHIPKVIKPENRPRTPFSFQRFLIPEQCNYMGKAIYLDADMLVFDDIADLWNTPLDDCDLQAVLKSEDSSRAEQYSVMLLNCNTLHWKIEDIVQSLNQGTLSYDELMYKMQLAPNIKQEIDSHWNDLERYEAQRTKLLHYTDMHKQPWVSQVNSLAYLWVAMLRNAISRGFISRDVLVQEIEKGNVRPSLLLQVEQSIDDPKLLDKTIKRVDKDFTPPYRKLRTGLKNQIKYFLYDRISRLKLI